MAGYVLTSSLWMKVAVALVTRLGRKNMEITPLSPPILIAVMFIASKWI